MAYNEVQYSPLHYLLLPIAIGAGDIVKIDRAGLQQGIPSKRKLSACIDYTFLPFVHTARHYTTN